MARLSNNSVDFGDLRMYVAGSPSPGPPQRGDRMKKRVEIYVPEIEDDIPIPVHDPTVYTKKIVAGELIRIAEKINPGQSVVLPVGSIGKFKRIVKSRGLKTVSFVRQTDTDARVWVVPPE
jgi:hypothetical protein